MEWRRRWSGGGGSGVAEDGAQLTLYIRPWRDIRCTLTKMREPGEPQPSESRPPKAPHRSSLSAAQPSCASFSSSRRASEDSSSGCGAGDLGFAAVAGRRDIALGAWKAA